jgi:hypothetical protein
MSEKLVPEPSGDQGVPEQRIFDKEPPRVGGSFLKKTEKIGFKIWSFS